MKKTAIILLVAAMFMTAFVGCNTAKETYELALVTDLGTIDDKSFNQGSYEGLVKYAQESGKTYKYYKPTEGSNDAYLAAINLAIDNGAKVVVCPGFLFQNSVYTAQSSHPDVKFVLIDAAPTNALDNGETTDGKPAVYNEDATADNTISILYKEEQAGFLAGYAVVKSGYTKIGFMGGAAVPAVVRYGYGFLEGADYAAQELGVQVTANYFYTNNFNASLETQGKAAAWYAAGTEIIFACGGNLGVSVMAAADLATTKVIGVDVDQSNISDSVANSAMKGLTMSVYDAVKSVYDGSWQGGTILNLGVESDKVGLAMSSNKLNFTQAEYEAIYAALKADTDGIASSIITDQIAGKQTTISDLKLKNVTVTVE